MTDYEAVALPNDPEAERAVLSAMLQDSEAAEKAASAPLEVFFQPRHQALFGAMSGLVRKGSKVDPVTLRDALGPAELDRVGGMEYIASLIDVVPHGNHVAAHLGILTDKASRRQLILSAQQLIKDAERKPLAELSVDTATILRVATPKAASARRCRTLAELLADPATQAAPLAVIPRLAWKGRVTLLAAREKDGKSTLASAGVAAVTQGRHFLGDVTTVGRVLWLAAEEHTNDLAQRAQKFGTHPDHLVVMGRPVPESLYADIRAEVEAMKPAALVIDTLASAVEGLVEDPHSSTAWTPVMSAITSIARDYELAILLLAHARKSDGSYRDSTAIGAGVDVILEMSTPVDDTTARTVKARGRWAMQPFTVRYNGDGFELSGGEISLDARLLLKIEGMPGLSVTKVRDAMGGRASAVDEALAALIVRGAVVQRDGPRGAKLLYPAQSAPSELTLSQTDSPDRVRDRVPTLSADPVPTLSPNELPPDRVASMSHPKTLGGEMGQGDVVDLEAESARIARLLDAEAQGEAAA